MRRSMLAAMLFLAVGCGGSSSNTTCNWTCDAQMGSKTYPAGSDAEAECLADFGGDCAHFACNCTN